MGIIYFTEEKQIHLTRELFINIVLSKHTYLFFEQQIALGLYYNERIFFFQSYTFLGKVEGNLRP